MDTKGGKWGGGGGMNWATGIDIYTLVCVKQITNKNLLYLKKRKKEMQKLDKALVIMDLIFILFRVVTTTQYYTLYLLAYLLF